MIQINMNHAQLAALWDYRTSQKSNRNFERIYAELRYLSAISDSEGGTYDALLRDVATALAADIAAAKFTQEAMLPSDLIETLAAAFAAVLTPHREERKINTNLTNHTNGRRGWRGSGP